MRDLRTRARNGLRDARVRLVLADEAQRLRPEAFDDLRDLSDGSSLATDAKVAVVFIGTDRLDAVLGRDEQVDDRYLACYHVNRLVGQQFVDAVALWEERVLCLPRPSNLTGKATLALLQGATRGEVGTLDALLRAAGRRALRSGTQRVTRDILEAVIKEYRRGGNAARD